MPTLRFRSPVTKPLLAFKAPKPVGDRSTFRVTSPFGERVDPLDKRLIPDKLKRKVFHGGLDMGDYGTGSSVVAMLDGTVEAVGYVKEPWSQSTQQWASGNYGGWMVVLRHHPRLVTIYAHLIPESSPVRFGDKVQAGQLLGRVGDSGSAQGQPHLHNGVQLDGRDIDPWPLIVGEELILEDDMQLPPNLHTLVVGRVGPNNRLRRDPNTTEGSWITTELIEVQVFGSEVPGEPYTLGGKTDNTYVWVGKNAETWFVATPLVTDMRLKGLGEALAPYTALDMADARTKGRASMKRDIESAISGVVA